MIYNKFWSEKLIQIDILFTISNLEVKAQMIFFCQNVIVKNSNHAIYSTFSNNFDDGFCNTCPRDYLPTAILFRTTTIYTTYWIWKTSISFIFATQHFKNNLIMYLRKIQFQLHSGRRHNFWLTSILKEHLHHVLCI